MVLLVIIFYNKIVKYELNGSYTNLMSTLDSFARSNS